MPNQSDGEEWVAPTKKVEQERERKKEREREKWREAHATRSHFHFGATVALTTEMLRCIFQ